MIGHISNLLLFEDLFVDFLKYYLILSNLKYILAAVSTTSDFSSQNNREHVVKKVRESLVDQYGRGYVITDVNELHISHFVAVVEPC